MLDINLAAVFLGHRLNFAGLARSSRNFAAIRCALVADGLQGGLAYLAGGTEHHDLFLLLTGSRRHVAFEKLGREDGRDRKSTKGRKGKANKEIAMSKKKKILCFRRHQSEIRMEKQSGEQSISVSVRCQEKWVSVRDFLRAAKSEVGRLRQLRDGLRMQGSSQWPAVTQCPTISKRDARTQNFEIKVEKESCWRSARPASHKQLNGTLGPRLSPCALCRNTP